MEVMDLLILEYFLKLEVLTLLNQGRLLSMLLQQIFYAMVILQELLHYVLVEESLLIKPIGMV